MGNMGRGEFLNQLGGLRTLAGTRAPNKTIFIRKSFQLMQWPHCISLCAHVKKTQTMRGILPSTTNGC